MVNQTNPDLVIAVVPGVEAHLPDIGREEAQPGVVVGEVRELLDAVAHLPHEGRLAGAPVAEQRDGQRRLGADRGGQCADGVHVWGDI
jgi:hypothetical protein